jgi:hypothetical protein
MLRPTRDDKKHAALCALRLVEALGPGARVGVAAGCAFCGLVGAEGRGATLLHLHGGQGERLVPPYTRGSVSLSTRAHFSGQRKRFLRDSWGGVVSLTNTAEVEVSSGRV